MSPGPAGLPGAWSGGLLSLARGEIGSARWVPFVPAGGPELALALATSRAHGTRALCWVAPRERPRVRNSRHRCGYVAAQPPLPYFLPRSGSW